MDAPTVMIITGMSGSGKRTALKVFEDIGFFCVDNVPVIIIPRIIELLTGEELNKSRIAFVVDVRDREFIARFPDLLSSLEMKNLHTKVIFLDCRDEILIRRFSETRRRHPLALSADSSVGISRERAVLAPLMPLIDLYIDTSLMNVHQLKEYLLKNMPEGDFPRITLTVMSFGYKYGLPPEADILFDVRFLPNPFFDVSLARLTGLDREIREFVMEKEVTRDFIDRVLTLMEFLLPHYIREGKVYLTVGFGCTGGRHRSVAIAEEVMKNIRNNDDNVNISVKHRDIDKG